MYMYFREGQQKSVYPLIRPKHRVPATDGAVSGQSMFSSRTQTKPLLALVREVLQI